MSTPILIVDLSSILHAVKHGISKSTILTYKERPTFVMFGFLTKLRAITEMVRKHHVVFACDSSNSKREQFWSGYKNKRKTEKTQEQIDLDAISYPQFKKVKEEILPAIGYENIFEFDGLEGDDIIAQIVLKNYPDRHITFATTDNDMYQCLTDNAYMLRHSTMKLYSKQDFIDAFRITPDLWKRVKAYGGCTTDEVPGIPIYDENGNLAKVKIGEGNALKYIRGEMKPTSNTYKAFKDPRNKEILERNKKLVILPFPGTPDISIKPNRLHSAGLRSICKKYGFNSILKDFEAYSVPMQLK